MNNTSVKLLNLLPVGYILTTPDDVIHSANEFFRNLIQLDEEALISKTRLPDLFTPNSRIYFETHIRPTLLEQGLIQEISIELRRQDKSLIPVLLNAATVRDTEQRITGIQYAFVDISQRKLYETELLLANKKQDDLLQLLNEQNKQISKDSEFYHSMIDNNSFFVCKTDLLGNYTYINSYHCKVMGNKPEDWIGRNSLEAIVPEDRQTCIDVVSRCFNDQKTSHWVTLRKTGLSGIMTHKWEFKLLHDDSGNPSEFLCIGHDISDLVKKQELLETQVITIKDQNERFTNFTRIISHNFRSHLANLKSLIRITDIENSEDVKSAFKMINQTIGVMSDSFNQLADITRIQSDTNIPMIELNLRKEISKVLNSVGQLIAESNTIVRLNITDDERLVSNQAYFESIVLNLITNAVRYRSPKNQPEIIISMENDEGYKVLTVSDNGQGIDLEKYGDRVFEIYQTFHGAKDSKGLGLFMSRIQIEAMKGKIEVQSDVGFGSAFKVYFPNNFSD